MSMTYDPKAAAAALEAAGWVPVDQVPEDWKKLHHVIVWIDDHHGCGGEHRARWDEDRYRQKPRPFWNWDGAISRTKARDIQPTHIRRPHPVADTPDQPDPLAAHLTAAMARIDELEDDDGEW